MAAVLHARRALNRERIFKDRLNPLEMLDEHEILIKYRFPSWAIRQIADMLAADIAHNSGRSGAVPPLIQVCLTLRYLAGGSFQDSVGEHFGLHQTTVSRSFHRVLDALTEIGPRFIRKPTQDEAQIQKRLFREVAGMPDVFGAIDCTHIKIKAPALNHHEFINRKNTYSINTQAVCDADLMVIDCLARFPGSVHDSRILRESGLFRAMEQRPKAINGILLGDSGYPIRDWLLTPFNAPEGEEENNFNNSHVLTRNVIERCFGVIKKRFYALHIGLRLDPPTACKAIYGCFVLHNIAMSLRIPIMEDNEYHPNADEINMPHQADGIAFVNERAKTEQGKAVRRHIARVFFTN